MRYAIIGVGGVGGLLGGLLARSGAPVTFVARGATLRALAASGLHVKSMMGDFSVTRPQLCPSPIELRDVDVAFVCVKGWQLDDVARELAAASQFDGAVIPLVNGVDGTAVVEAAVGALRTIGGLCRMVSEIESPGVIRHWAVPPSVHCGELDGCRSDRIIEIASDLERSGVTTEVSTNIIGAIWAKAAFISSWGTFCAAARAPIGEVRQTALGQTVLRCAVEEILAVGAAAGVTLPQECAATVFAEIMALQAGATSSLQRDMDAGRQSELDWQLGRLLTKAPVHGVAVPTLSAAYAILHIRERTNAELRVGETGPPPQRMLTRPGIGD